MEPVLLKIHPCRLYVIVKVHLSVSTLGRERSESPRRLNGENTERMYFKHLSVESILDI